MIDVDDDNLLDELEELYDNNEEFLQTLVKTLTIESIRSYQTMTNFNINKHPYSRCCTFYSFVHLTRVKTAVYNEDDNVSCLHCPLCFIDNDEMECIDCGGDMEITVK